MIGKIATRPVGRWARASCRAFSWNPVETSSGRRHCMMCSSTDMVTDDSDSWQTYAMVYSAWCCTGWRVLHVFSAKCRIHPAVRITCF